MTADAVAPSAKQQQQEQQPKPENTPILSPSKPAMSTVDKTTFREYCHTGPLCIFDLSAPDRPEAGPFIWAGSAWEVQDEEWDLVISLKDRFYDTGFENPVTGSPAVRRMLPRRLFSHITAPQLVINWPDYNVPKLTPEWWHVLVNSLAGQKKEDKSKPFDIAIHCNGGHGRTGTALAIIGCLSHAIPFEDDPIAWVRANYCPEAVESQTQIGYVEFVTGRRSASKPQPVKTYQPFSTQRSASGNWSSNPQPQPQRYDPDEIGVDDDGLVYQMDAQTGRITVKTADEYNWDDYLERSNDDGPYHETLTTDPREVFKTFPRLDTDKALE